MITLCLTLLLAASPELEDARVAIGNLKYAEAATLLKRVTADPTTPAADRAEAFDLLARAHVARGDLTAARADYDALLALEPMTPDPQASPKIRAVFTAAKQARFSPRHLVLTRRPSAAEVLEVDVVNPWRLPVTIELWVATGGTSFEKRELGVENGRVLTALGEGSKSYLRALGQDGVVLSTLGSPNEPLLGPPPAAVAEPKPPLAVEPLATDAPKRDPKPSLEPRVEPSTAATPGVTATQWNAQKTLGLIGGITAVALLATGIALLVMGTNEVDAAENNTGGQCFPDCSTAPGRTKQAIGAGLGIGGVLLSVGSVYLLLTANPSSEQHSEPVTPGR